MALPPIAAAGVIFVFVSTGAAVGITLQRLQPEYHRTDASKDIVKTVLGLLGTMTALILSLLIAAAHGFYDTQRSEIQQLSVDVLMLDDSLTRYGPAADPVRATLRTALGTLVDTMSPGGETTAVARLTASRVGVADVLDAIGRLTPATEAQHLQAARAAALAQDIASTRLLIHEQRTTAFPVPLAVILLCWLVVLFVGFGLFAPLNATVIGALGIGALSVSAAMLLMLSMSHPYGGLMGVSDRPLRLAVAQIGQTP
jgi:hypothetical protein